MYKNNIEDRQYVSRIIYSVLSDRISVREAILNYPKKTKDKSLKTAYHAIVHREADEELRARDLEYKEEQDEYLEFLAQTLQEGKDIPKNIIKEYEQWYREEEKYLPDLQFLKPLFKKLCEFLNI